MPGEGLYERGKTLWKSREIGKTADCTTKQVESSKCFKYGRDEAISYVMCTSSVQPHENKINMNMNLIILHDGRVFFHLVG